MTEPQLELASVTHVGPSATRGIVVWAAKALLGASITGDRLEVVLGVGVLVEGVFRTD